MTPTSLSAPHSPSYDSKKTLKHLPTHFGFIYKNMQATLDAKQKIQGEINVYNGFNKRMSEMLLSIGMIAAAIFATATLMSIGTLSIPVSGVLFAATMGSFLFSLGAFISKCYWNDREAASLETLNFIAECARKMRDDAFYLQLLDELKNKEVHERTQIEQSVMSGLHYSSKE